MTHVLLRLQADTTQHEGESQKQPNRIVCGYKGPVHLKSRTTASSSSSNLNGGSPLHTGQQYQPPMGCIQVCNTSVQPSIGAKLTGWGLKAIDIKLISGTTNALHQCTIHITILMCGASIDAVSNDHWPSTCKEFVSSKAKQALVQQHIPKQAAKSSAVENADAHMMHGQQDASTKPAGEQGAQATRRFLDKMTVVTRSSVTELLVTRGITVMPETCARHEVRHQGMQPISWRTRLSKPQRNRASSRCEAWLQGS